MGKSGRKIKLSKNLKPFVSRVSRGGAVQQAFKAKIGDPVGKCVATSVTFGMTTGQVKAQLKKCSELGAKSLGSEFISMSDPDRKRKVYERSKAKKGT